MDKLLISSVSGKPLHVHSKHENIGNVLPPHLKNILTDKLHSNTVIFCCADTVSEVSRQSHISTKKAQGLRPSILNEI